MIEIFLHFFNFFFFSTFLKVSKAFDDEHPEDICGIVPFLF
jgi:hypothetical protein